VAALYPARIFFALMQPINLNFPSLQLDVQSPKIQDILNNLQQAGLFRAIVVQQKGNQVVLDTAFGKVSGKSPDALKAGDEILARMTSLQPEPTLKIEQHIAKLVSLPRAQFKGLAQYSATTYTAAKVIQQTENQTLLKINQQLVPITRQNTLQVGETLLLRADGPNHLQLLRIQPQSILKAALSALIPRALQPQGRQYDLSTLQNFAREITAKDTQALINRANIKTAELLNQQAASQSPAAHSAKSPVAENIVRPSELKVLTDIIRSLSAPLANAENIKPQALQQAFSLLALIKSEMPPNPNNLGQQLQHLYQELKQSPETFRQLVQQIFQHSQNADQKTVHHERALVDLSSTLKLELMQQTEQSLTHLLSQQSSTRLQLEQHQPLNLFLNIPIQVDQQSRNLQLKIQQKRRPDLDENVQSWEIDLSFEFGLLGMITTRILLQDNKISANFWAHQKETKNLIDTHLEQFKTQLTKAGFTLGLFDCFEGPAPQATTSKPYYMSDNLVDLEA
jgi:hypothetical protein